MLLLKLVTDLCLMALPSRGRADHAGIVRLDAIGDFVVWLPAAQALVEHLHTRNQRVVLIANHLWAPWAHTLLAVDDVVPVDVDLLGKSLRYRWSMLRHVRRLELGTIVLPTYSRIPCDGNDAVAFASGARQRIASQGYTSRHRLAGWLRRVLNMGYSQLIPADDRTANDLPKSEPEINAGFMKGLGVPLRSLIGKLPPGPADELAEFQLPTGKYVVIFPGGSWSGKAWPAARYAEVACKLKSIGLEIVVSGSAGERTLCEELASASGGLNLAGCTSLQSLAEVIRGARLVIGNDSAGMHIAVAAGVDSVCVMWGGSFGRFIPYATDLLPPGLTACAVYHRMDCFGCTGACPLPPVDGKVPCIAAVPASEVWATVNQVLRNRDATSTQNPSAGAA